MAKAKVVKDEKGKFFLAWHDGQGMRIYSAPGTNLKDIVLKPFVKTPIDPAWEDVPDFIRDADEGTVHTEWSNKLPPKSPPQINSKWEDRLDLNEIGLVTKICADPEFGIWQRDIVSLYKHIGDDGLAREPNTAVTVPWLKEKHLPFCMATLELEKAWRNRPEVVSELQAAIQYMKAL